MRLGRPGTFISFEGIEGSGKSTQMRLLENRLRSDQLPVVCVREPGGTHFSELVRELVLGYQGLPLDPWAELCLYAAARAQLVREVIQPALKAGSVVLADRFAEASVAYQGGGRRLGASRVRSLNAWVTGGLRPDRILLFDLDPGEGLDRIRCGRGEESMDRLEREPVEFHSRVRTAYLRMAQREPGLFSVLDAALPPENLHALVLESVLPLVAP